MADLFNAVKGMIRLLERLQRVDREDERRCTAKMQALHCEKLFSQTGSYETRNQNLIIKRRCTRFRWCHYSSFEKLDTEDVQSKCNHLVNSRI